MPTHSEEFTLSLALTESMHVCAEAVATLGWRVIEQSMTRLKCAEVKTQLVSFTWPVQVEIILKGEPSGGVRVTLNGSTFGLGSMQSSYLAEQVQNLRHTIEHTVSRKTAKHVENAPASESQSEAAGTLASELEKLARLHASGALSDQEFQQAKQRLLEQSAPQSSNAQQATNSSRTVFINSVRLSDEQLRQLEQRFQLRIADGAYWYDQVSGAWGMQGGPTIGFTQPHLELGGTLRRDASNGNTGVIINGRELHQQDVLALRQLTPYVIPGRYWVDARGIGGYEGGPPIFDLQALARAAGGGRGGAWSYTSLHGSGTVGGDGEGFSYFSSKDTSWTSGD
jgi:Short C-terminal domain